MKSKKIVCILLIIAAIACCISPTALSIGSISAETPSVCATGNFSFDVRAGSTGGSSSTLPLDDGDAVVIRATYTPASASVDFGIIAPNGQFYHVNVTGGVADITIHITRRGNYTFAIRNNSSSTISVSGYINY